MPRYKVTGWRLDKYECEVEAKTESEAIKEAKNLGIWENDYFNNVGDDMDDIQAEEMKDE